MSRLNQLSAFMGRRLLWLLLGSYVLAALCPGAGLALRRLTVGEITVAGTALQFNGPTVLLMLLLCNASLGIGREELRAMVERPGLLLASLAANVVVPLGFVGMAALLLRGWGAPHEAGSLVVGLAILATMPIAGTSTAWAQQAGGNPALSVGLVICTTTLSPILAPACLRAISLLTGGRHAAALNALAGTHTQLFLALAVVLPCFVGVGVHLAMGRVALAAIMPTVKLGNKVILLLLNYTNAAVALPQLLLAPQWDLLALSVALACGLCALRFFAARAVAHRLHLALPETASVVFALGMNNNGSGLVLAAQQLPQETSLLFLIVVYNMAQQIGAGLAHVRLGRAEGA